MMLICPPRKTNNFVCFLILLFLIFSFTCCTIRETTPTPQPSVHNLVVLHTNDTHGHPVKFFNHPAPDVGGLPARATLFKRIRKENKNVLVLDAGDLNTGRPESNLFRAKPDIEGYNYIGYDAMVLGNHEFDNSMDVLREQMKQAAFPFLSANVKTRDGQYLTHPYMIKRFSGFKVAIFGLTTKETAVFGNPENVKDLIFEDEVAVAKKLVPRLKEEADLVIALVHLGIFESFKKGSKRLATEVTGIDLIVDGHSHTKPDYPIVVEYPGSDHRTLIVQAWKWGLVVGRVDLWVKNKGVVDFKFKAIPINLKRVHMKYDGSRAYQFIGEKIEEDVKLLNLLQPYVDKTDALLSQVIGYAEETFFFKDTTIKETALGDMIADSMLWYTRNLGVDFAIQNGGGIRADLPRGMISRKTIYEILPFDNALTVLTLRGADVQSLFDYIGAGGIGEGAFPQVSQGVTFTMNRLTKQCENILINGKSIDPQKNYKIATNSYLAKGGDGYMMFLQAIETYDTALFQRDVFIEYITFLGGNIRPRQRGRIEIITRSKTRVSLKMAA